jgi:hypothetical protein
MMLHFKKKFESCAKSQYISTHSQFIHDHDLF